MKFEVKSCFTLSTRYKVIKVICKLHLELGTLISTACGCETAFILSFSLCGNFLKILNNKMSSRLTIIMSDFLHVLYSI